MNAKKAKENINRFYADMPKSLYKDAIRKIKEESILGRAKVSISYNYTVTREIIDGIAFKLRKKGFKTTVSSKYGGRCPHLVVEW